MVLKGVEKWYYTCVTSISYTARILDKHLQMLMAEFPAIMVTGPRASGKTTTLTRLAATTRQLNEDRSAAAFRADPDAALQELDEPIFLDEYQEVPSVLSAIKRSVDQNYSPGRFLLSGSVRATLNTTSWPTTGRII
ncbi:MAG: AAA family ATPase, partial [Acidimicrobiales bacterium]|nr:AAA family ATPase [Acidimicrobiales bacterium]